MRKRRATASDIAADLMAVKLLIKGLSGAMPTLQREIQRDACERIDDIITDLGSLKR